MVSRAPSCHGSGSNCGSSTTLVSSRPSTSTLVATKRRAEGERVGSPGMCIPHGFGGGEHGPYDLRVGAAATQITAHPANHIRLGGGCRALQQRNARHDLPGCAVAALQCVVLNESALQR